MPRRRAEWTWTLPKQVDRPPRGAVAPTAYDTSNEPTELLGWGCEACEEEILGERFTCEECSYDVCEACHVANRVKGRRNKLHKHFLWRMGHVEEIRKAVTEGRAASGRKAAAKEVLSDSESESTEESSEESAEKEDEEEKKVAPEAMKEDTDEEAAEVAAAKEEEEEKAKKRSSRRAKPKPPAAKRQKKGVKEADGMRQPSIMEAMSTPAAEPEGTPEAPPVAAMPEAESAEPAAEPEAAPPTNAVVAPAATPQAAPVTTPAEKPVATPQATPVATLAEPPQATPVATAQASAATPVTKPAATPATPMPVTTPAAEPIAASQATPVATPQATPVTTPAAKPVATPQVTPVATFAETPQATPVATPAATPQAMPAAKPATPKPAKPAKPVSQADLAAMPKLLSFDDAGSGTVEGGEERDVRNWLTAGFRTSHAVLARLPVPHMEAWTETVDIYAGGNASTHLPVAVGAGEARAASGSQLVSLGWWADAVRRSRPLRDVQVCACGEGALNSDLEESRDALREAEAARKQEAEQAATELKDVRLAATPLLAVLSNAEAAFKGATAPPSHYVLFTVPGKPNRFAAVRPVPALTLPEFNGAVLSVAFMPQESSPDAHVVVAFTAEVASDAATTTIGFFTLPTSLPAAPDAACGILAADVVAVSVRLAGRYTACAWIGGSLVVWDASGGLADARVLCGGPSHALRAAGTVGAVTAAAPLTAGRGALITVAPAQPAAGATLPSSRLALWRVKGGGAVAHQEWPALPQVSCVEWAAPCPPVVGTTAGEVGVFGRDGQVAVWLACSPCPVSLWPRAVRGLVPGRTGVAWLLDGGLALRTVLPGERSACEVCSRAGGSLKGPCACGREIAPVAWLVPKKEEGSLLLAVGAGVPGCFVEQGFGVCKECAEPVCGCAAGVGGSVAPELKDAVRWFAEEVDVDASCRSVLRGAAGKLVLANLSAGFVVLLEA